MKRETGAGRRTTFSWRNSITTITTIITAIGRPARDCRGAASPTDTTTIIITTTTIEFRAQHMTTAKNRTSRSCFSFVAMIFGEFFA